LEGLTKGEMRVFEALFKGVSTRIWATNNWKSIRKSGTHFLFLLPKSSFGEHKVVTKDSSIPEKPTHRMLLLSFVLILQSCYKR
jgi:hypothetical protein